MKTRVYIGFAILVVGFSILAALQSFVLSSEWSVVAIPMILAGFGTMLSAMFLAIPERSQHK